MIIVSLSSEVNAVGAIGVTGAFLSLVITLFIGFSVGVNVVVARCIGEGNEEKISTAVHTAVCLGLLLGISGAAIGVGISRLVLTAMGVMGNLLDLAVKYTCLYFVGLPFVALTNFLLAIFRAKGNSRISLIVLSLAGILNVGLNSFFVLVLNMSVDGVAIATVLANVFSFVVLFIKLMREKDSTVFSFKKLKIDKVAIKEILVIGFPAAIQSAIIEFSNVVIQSSIVTVNNLVCPPDSIYQPVVDGCSAGRNLSAFVYSSQNAVYQGVVTFTSQNMGAKKPCRVYRVMGAGYLLTTIIGLSVIGTIFLNKTALLGFYGITGGEEGSLEAVALSAANTQLKYECLPYFLCGILEVGSGILRGMGKSTVAMMISLIGTCALRVVWIWLAFPFNKTLEMLYICYPISWFLTGLVLFICAITFLSKQVKSIQKGCENTPYND